MVFHLEGELLLNLRGRGLKSIIYNLQPGLLVMKLITIFYFMYEKEDNVCLRLSVNRILDFILSDLLNFTFLAICI